MPVVVLDRCPVSTCRKLWSPAVAVRRSGRVVSVRQQRQARTVQLCSRQLPWVVSSGQLTGSFWGLAHRCRADMTPGISPLLPLPFPLSPSLPTHTHTTPTHPTHPPPPSLLPVNLSTVQVTVKTVTSLISIRYRMQTHVHGFSVDNCRKTHFNSILKLFTCCLWQGSLKTTWTYPRVQCSHVQIEGE